MRRAAKVDANQAEIVAGLRKVGCSVESLAAVGKGVPDLLVGYGSKNYLLEVKDGSKPPSARKLTDAQVEWHKVWRGSVYTINSTQEALDVMGIGHRGQG